MMPSLTILHELGHLLVAQMLGSPFLEVTPDREALDEIFDVDRKVPNPLANGMPPKRGSTSLASVKAAPIPHTWPPNI